MKASVFIKTAMIDQMQQIADLGLWFHLSRLLPSGVELLARVRYAGAPYNYDGNVFLPETLERMVKLFYKEFFPEKYTFSPTQKEFFNIYPQLFLTSNESEAHLHLTQDEKEIKYIHVPAWFADFKIACQIVLGEIKAGRIEDIEVLKTLDK